MNRLPKPVIVIILSGIILIVAAVLAFIFLNANHGHNKKKSASNLYKAVAQETNKRNVTNNKNKLPNKNKEKSDDLSLPYGFTKENFLNTHHGYKCTEYNGMDICENKEPPAEDCPSTTTCYDLVYYFENDGMTGFTSHYSKENWSYICNGVKPKNVEPYTDKKQFGSMLITYKNWDLPLGKFSCISYKGNDYQGNPVSEPYSIQFTYSPPKLPSPPHPKHLVDLGNGVTVPLGMTEKAFRHIHPEAQCMTGNKIRVCGLKDPSPEACPASQSCQDLVYYFKKHVVVGFIAKYSQEVWTSICKNTYSLSGDPEMGHDQLFPLNSMTSEWKISGGVFTCEVIRSADAYGRPDAVYQLMFMKGGKY